MTPALKNHGDKSNHVLSLSIDFTSREIQTEWNSWSQIKWSKAIFEHILNKLSNYLLQGDVNTFTGPVIWSNQHFHCFDSNRVDKAINFISFIMTKAAITSWYYFFVLVFIFGSLKKITLFLLILAFCLPRSFSNCC